jgi:hypothetical protein
VKECGGALLYVSFFKRVRETLSVKIIKFMILVRVFHDVPYIVLAATLSDLEEKNMKKIVGMALLLLVFAGVFSGVVAADYSYGPAPLSGDGDPDGNQFIRPDNPGDGPAPNSGDGDPDGSGF